MNGYSHFQEYPKWVHNQAGEARLIQTRDQEKALPDGWDFGPHGTPLPVRAPQTAAEAEAMEAVALLKPLLETARLLTPDGSDLEVLTRLNEWAHEQMAYGSGSVSIGGSPKRKAS